MRAQTDLLGLAGSQIARRLAASFCMAAFWLATEATPPGRHVGVACPDLLQTILSKNEDETWRYVLWPPSGDGSSE